MAPTISPTSRVRIRHRFLPTSRLPIFDRNQGEIARTSYALTQAQEQEQSASDTVLSDVANAYEAVKSNDEVVQLYTSGYLQAGAGFARHQRVRVQARRGQPAGFSRCRAQLPFHAIGLSPGLGLLHDCTRAIEGSGGNEEPAMTSALIRQGPSGRCGSQSLLLRRSRYCSRAAKDQVRTPRPITKNVEQSRTVHHSARADVACAGAEGSADDADPNPAADRSGCLQRIPHHSGHHAGEWSGQSNRRRSWTARASRAKPCCSSPARIIRSCARTI